MAFKQQIIRHLRHSEYKPRRPQEIAKFLGVKEKDREQFEKSINELLEAGHILIGTGELVRLPHLSGTIIGRYRANPRRFGFVMPLEPSHGDLFIPPDAGLDAMSGDIVEAKIVRTGKREGQLRYSGRITKVLERANNRFVGTLVQKQGRWIVDPDGTTFIEPIYIDDIAAKEAKANDKVVVEIISFPTEAREAKGVLLEVLGKAGKYDAEIKSVIEQFQLPKEFKDKHFDQAAELARGFESDKAKDREDITGKKTITIDPPTAKDFDDAISLETDEAGNSVLGVHIADVSHFIEENSPLDLEAKDRGNSIYLPGKTIPMLPEVLSNGICSLQPDQRRFVKSVYITYDDDAKVLSTRFANSVISSTQRLTYIQADKAIKGESEGVKEEVVELLVEMEKLAKAIERRRKKQGTLHLDLAETELIRDENGQVVDAEPAENSYPHTLIEMFMVEANESVAGLMDKLNVPLLRRIHPDPDDFSLELLSKQVRAFGMNLPKKPSRKAIQSMLNSVRGKDESLAINLLVLRSLQKAQYSPLHFGHFALASKHYCHFTSPIRRYADLVVHRVLGEYLKAGKKPDVYPDQQQLVEIGDHISFTEKRAEDAEHDLRDVLILQMLSGRIGSEFDGVVTGVTGFGVFVQSKKFGVEGMIPLEDLGQDRWEYNQKGQYIIGARSRGIIRLGQGLNVRIVSINLPARKLNLGLAQKLHKAKGEVVPKEKGSKRRGRNKGKAKTSKGRRRR